MKSGVCAIASYMLCAGPRGLDRTPGDGHNELGVIMEFILCSICSRYSTSRDRSSMYLGAMSLIKVALIFSITASCLGPDLGKCFDQLFN